MPFSKVSLYARILEKIEWLHEMTGVGEELEAMYMVLAKHLKNTRSVCSGLLCLSTDKEKINYSKITCLKKRGQYLWPAAARQRGGVTDPRQTHTQAEPWYCSQ